MKKLHRIETYQDLLNCLKKMTKAQLRQRVQFTLPGPIEEKPVECQPVIAIGTMEQMEFYAARSVSTNKFEPSEVVMLGDYNPFSKDGAIAHEVQFDKKSKNKIFNTKPIYGKLGKTKKEDQINPEYVYSEDNLSRHLISTLQHRTKKYDTHERIPKSSNKIDK